MQYIGDLSRQDAQILATYAGNATRILEFGVGASTQILAQSASPTAQIYSVDTNPRWIERTKRNFTRLNIQRPVEFLAYESWQDSVPTSIDLAFDDGADDRRLDFGLVAWTRLRIGGMLLLHDTRRERDFANVLEIMKKNHLEIDVVQVNERASNITVLKRKINEPYVNWNHIERRRSK